MDPRLLADLMSVPAWALAVVYAIWMTYRWRPSHERLPVVLTTWALAIAATGFLLRPITSIDGFGPGERDIVALIIRTLFLIVMLGLVWHLIDKWKETR